MSHDIGLDETFLLSLAAIDAARAKEVHAAGCAECGGPLDVATYPRKPRGELGSAESVFTFRESFCCRDCRQRATPPSLRFLGRKVYVAVVVVIASLAGRRRPIAASVPARTVRRWRMWWTTIFLASAFWTEARALFATPVDEARMPGSLLDRFGGESAAALGKMLRFVSPITTTSVRARILMAV